MRNDRVWPGVQARVADLVPRVHAVEPEVGAALRDEQGRDHLAASSSAIGKWTC